MRRAGIWKWVATVVILPSVARAADEPAKLVDPTAVSPASTVNSTLVLLATTSEKTARIRLGLDLGDRGPGRVLAAISIAGPFDTSGDQATQLASLDGLARATSVEGSLQLVSWHPTTSAEGIRRVCEKYLAQPECSRGDLPSPAAKKDFDAQVDYGTPWLLSASGQIGKQHYSWLEGPALEAGSGDRTPWAIKAGAGVVLSHGFLGASYRYEVSYQAGESTQVCTPLGTSGATRCDKAVLGAPTAQRSNIGSAEARLFWRQFGVNPRVNYDFDDDVLGLELPVYFIQNGDSGLTGGVSLGWRSDDHDPAIQLFVANTFELLPKR